MIYENYLIIVTNEGIYLVLPHWNIMIDEVMVSLNTLNCIGYKQIVCND